MQDNFRDACETIQENLLAFWNGQPQDLLDKTCQIVVDGFSPLFAQRERVRKALCVLQVGTSYRVVKATNVFDYRMGVLLSREDVEKLVANGITVTVSPNK